jgi:hypothetical protein
MGRSNDFGKRPFFWGGGYLVTEEILHRAYRYLLIYTSMTFGYSYSEKIICNNCGCSNLKTKFLKFLFETPWAQFWRGLM